MLKVEFSRDLGDREKRLQHTAFTRDLAHLPRFLLDTRPSFEEVSEDFLPFPLKYTVDKAGYALVPTSGAPMLSQNIAIRASQIPL